ncbi:BSD domain-containing protein 1 isoform X2 [Dendrobates tinctorius]|uniref:BSD domain-containing protein 1 isoform X2 n=1 Tax=Dendrobates tinctorius TaxID=92724 RepID=UPI003CC97DD4
MPSSFSMQPQVTVPSCPGVPSSCTTEPRCPGCGHIRTSAVLCRNYGVRVREDGGWWRSWIHHSYSSVREKSAEALEFMKRDLSEFSRVVQHDTACTIAATATVVKEKLAVEGSSGTTEKVKKSISDFLGVISDTFAPSPDKTIDCDVITLMATPSGTTELYDSTKARLYSLQSDPATYCNEPDGPLTQFDEWVTSWESEERKADISELLVSSPSIRALYTKMVPAAVSHSEFWQRYFYKVHQLEQHVFSPAGSPARHHLPSRACQTALSLRRSACLPGPALDSSPPRSRRQDTEEARRDALKQRAEQSVHLEDPRWEEEEEEFVGAGSPRSASYEKNLRILPSAIPTLNVETSSEEPEQHGKETVCITSPSESSESISPITQIDNPAYHDLTTQDEDSACPSAVIEELLEDKPNKQYPPNSDDQGAKANTQNAVRKDEPASDLRVFELNSDSGKSTPSNNGQKGSSTDVSEDWEKDFDMTEEEVQLALSRVEVSGELEDEDWENWE